MSDKNTVFLEEWKIIKPEEIRLRFTCPNCGVTLWTFAQNTHNDTITCYRCKTIYNYGAIITEIGSDR